MSSGGESISTCGFGRLLKMRQRVFRHHERAARVDLMHQVEALHLGRQASSVSWIAEALLTTMSMPPNVSAVRAMASFTAASSRMSTASGSALPPAFSIARGRGVDRAFELRVRLGGLGGDRDVGAVARGAKRDGEPDAARRAGDEERLSGEAHACQASPYRARARSRRLR